MCDNKNEESTKISSKECPCLSVGFAEAALGVKFPFGISKTSIGIIDFGEVLPGNLTTKCIELKNNLDQPVSYYVHRMSYVHDIYQSFHFNKYNVTVNPRTISQLKITYSPLFENEKSSDLFVVSARDSTELEKLRLIGKCLGTKVKCSTKRLYFTVTPNVVKRVNTFELKNVSKVPATFQFDINENEEVFLVDIVNGQIQPKKSIYITVTFNGKIEGMHYKKLVALIYKHEPILIDLVGIYSKNRNYENDLRNVVMYPYEVCNIYDAYFNDFGSADEKLLPYKFNQNYIDFGRVLPQHYARNRSDNIAVAIIKNNMVHDILIKWYNDPDKIFSVNPNVLDVKPDETGYFEVTFNPDFRDHLYFRKMSAQIHWRNTPRPNTPIALNCDESQEDEHVPLEANIIMIGHSFPENQLWISAVEIIPAQILFPVCIPGHQSYSTFMMKSDGHLPVLFKFISPRKSSITVKPMMGLMRFTKLFVVKLQTQATSTLYKEEWRMEINGMPQKYLKITFLGQSAVPSVLIGDNNTIHFNATLPGCQDIVKVPIKNTSCYHLRLELIGSHEYFHVKPPFVELYPNEEIDTEWTFNAKLDVPDQTDIQCSMRVISNLDQLIGLPFEVDVKIHAACEYAQICATPRYTDFGEVPWGAEREVHFKIFNFGKSAVCYALKAITFSENHDTIKISHTFGRLRPNENTTVCISFKTKTAGDHVAQIVYMTRINEFGEVLAPNPPVDLFSIKYRCIHPALQIEECVEHNLGILFSKLDMWNFFCVNRINEDLVKVREGETRTIKIELPSTPCHEKEYHIRFVLRNITKFDLDVSLSRVKMCSCQITEISKSLSFRQKVFKCPHRNMLRMQLSDETIHGLSFQYLDVFMNFNIITNDQVAYDLKLAKQRHIELCFQIDSISLDIRKLSVYNIQRHKRFLNMFIGAKEPPYQTVWLYNYTSQEADYHVIEEQIDALNENEGFPVLSCLNYRGTVPPLSSKAILFRFHPIEAKKYQATVPMILGSEKISMKFTGRGTYKYDHDLIHNLNSPMPGISFHFGEFPITLSAEYMIIEAFSVWSDIERMIYMRNITKDREIKYTWQKSFIEGIIEIEADESSGIIEPDEVIAILLKVKSFEIPAISTINMSCELVDITQNERHKKSLQEYQERQKEIEQYFMIDEKGMHTATNDYIIEPPSELKYLTIAVTFHTISTLELSHYLDVEQFLGQNPLETFEPKKTDTSKICANKEGETIEEIELCNTYNPFISQILECFIMDTLRSPVSQELVRCYQKATPPYYVQFKQDEEKKKASGKKTDINELKKYFAKSQIKDVSETFKFLMKDSIQQIFF
ncbi:cilia- and flagella-associated protein 65 [Harmonia axyridis]|uniref:cilia- and flagella-associated protein 65 n=1 Tax=Harmonia axyridis TaxID=115357 RepID=UPI001E278D69|nr:cilia- and flagella-associated protein 65 [Harmonia axyridis]